MNIVITAGGISEYIDNVRKITNSSTGKLGLVIANTFLSYNNIDLIYYVCPKNALKPNHEKVKIIEVNGADNTKCAIEDLLINNKIDIFIHSMAVSDYTINYVTNMNYLDEALNTKDYNTIKDVFSSAKKYNESKIPSNEDNLILVLKPTPKIISIIKNISPKTILVGFKLLDNVDELKLIKVAKELRDKNKCDYVIANDLANIKQGNHTALIIDKNDNITKSYGKEDIAKKLVKRLIKDKQL